MPTSNCDSTSISPLHPPPPVSPSVSPSPPKPHWSISDHRTVAIATTNWTYTVFLQLPVYKELFLSLKTKFLSLCKFCYLIFKQEIEMRDDTKKYHQLRCTKVLSLLYPPPVPIQNPQTPHIDSPLRCATMEPSMSSWMAWDLVNWLVARCWELPRWATSSYRCATKKAVWRWRSYGPGAYRYVGRIPIASYDFLTLYLWSPAKSPVKNVACSICKGVPSVGKALCGQDENFLGSTHPGSTVSAAVGIQAVLHRLHTTGEFSLIWIKFWSYTYIIYVVDYRVGRLWPHREEGVYGRGADNARRSESVEYRDRLVQALWHHLTGQLSH